jgi:hypothetical protein
MKKFWLLLLLFFCLISSVWAAGTTSFSYQKDGNWHIYTWACTSHTDGTLSGVGTITGISGYLYQVEVIPDDAGDVIFAGDNQPTTGFNVELKGTYLSEDVLYDTTASCSNSAVTRNTPLNSNGGLIQLKNDTLTPYASGVGSAKKFYLKVKIIK